MLHFYLFLKESSYCFKKVFKLSVVYSRYGWNWNTKVYWTTLNQPYNLPVPRSYLGKCSIFRPHGEPHHDVRKRDICLASPTGLGTNWVKNGTGGNPIDSSSSLPCVWTQTCCYFRRWYAAVCPLTHVLSSLYTRTSAIGDWVHSVPYQESPQGRNSLRCRGKTVADPGLVSCNTVVWW